MSTQGGEAVAMHHPLPVLTNSSKLGAPLENAGRDCPELTPHGGTTHRDLSHPRDGGGSLGQQKARSGDDSAADVALLLLFFHKVVERLQ